MGVEGGHRVGVCRGGAEADEAVRPYEERAAVRRADRGGVEMVSHAIHDFIKSVPARAHSVQSRLLPEHDEMTLAPKPQVGGDAFARRRAAGRFASLANERTSGIENTSPLLRAAKTISCAVAGGTLGAISAAHIACAVVRYLAALHHLRDNG